jgi:hypothetical protein
MVSGANVSAHAGHKAQEGVDMFAKQLFVNIFNLNKIQTKIFFKKNNTC